PPSKPPKQNTKTEQNRNKIRTEGEQTEPPPRVRRNSSIAVNHRSATKRREHIAGSEKGRERERNNQRWRWQAPEPPPLAGETRERVWRKG
ncbi:hypothetical protein A2U01_0051936, partial [Trifolium medium]|nr:hypothetical protein [Trifolium medium]